MGSYTQAARELSLTQSAVSRRVARLEKAINARLFDRGRLGVRLTSEGSRILNYANGAELMLARAVESVQDDVRRANGECKLLMGEGLGGYWMPPFLDGFFEGNPDVNLKLFTSAELGRDQIPPFDVQIHYAHPLAMECVSIRVATLHFMLFATATYLKQFGAPADLRDLARHRVVDSTFRLVDRGSLASWASLTQDVTLATNSSLVLAESVRCGSAIGLLPTYTSVLEQRLIACLPDTHFEAPVFLCFERETAKRPAVRATLDYLKEFVFDNRRMPWFFEHFVAPQKDWKRIYDSCRARAADNHSPHAAIGS